MSEATPPGAPRLWGWQTALGLVVALGLLAGLAFAVDLDAVGRELARCDLSLVFLGMLCHYASYFLRGARWRRMLRHVQKKAGTWAFTILVFFYNFIDNLVPARLGDVYGAHLARINFGVSGSAALGSIVFQRMVDAWVVVGLAAWSSAAVFSERLPTGVLWALVFGAVFAVAVSVLLLTFVLLGKVSAERIPEALRRRIDSFRVGMWPRRGELLRIAALTAAVWGLELLWMLLLLRGFHLDPSFPEVAFVSTISLLATAVPLTPSGAGFVELSLYGCLRAVGADAALATSVTVVNRFLDYWLHLVLGVLVWAFRRRLGLQTWRRPGGQDRIPS